MPQDKKEYITVTDAEQAYFTEGPPKRKKKKKAKKPKAKGAKGSPRAVTEADKDWRKFAQGVKGKGKAPAPEKK